MTTYLPARIVGYEVSGNDDLLSSLIRMQEYDHEFSEKTLNDAYIWKVFDMQFKHKIGKETKKTHPVQLAMMIIVGGLKNRARFAIQQKERLRRHINDLHPPELKSHVIHEVDSELERVIKLIVHFTEFDQDLKQLSFEVGARYRDETDLSNACQIPDDM